MTIKELIEFLNEIEDKNMDVVTNDDLTMGSYCIELDNLNIIELYKYKNENSNKYSYGEYENESKEKTKVLEIV